MRVKRALNLVTIRNAPFAKKLEIARAAGYEGVGLWVDETEEAGRAAGGLQAVGRLLKDHDLVPAELCFVGGWMYPSESERVRSRESAQRAFRIAEILGCECVAACASAGAGDLDDAASDFAELCTLAARFGVKVALEFLGGGQQVKDARTAWHIVEEADAPNGGLLIDTFHFYKGGSDVADLEPVTGDKIYLLHVNDSPDLPREELEDRNRVFPGTGVIPLEEIAAEVVNKGYRGYFSLELFNEDYWASDPFVVAEQGLQSLKRAGI